jgi:uncharacterized protein
MFWIILIGTVVISALVAGNFKRKFARYAQMPTSSGLSGKEVAEKMLRDNGIYDVKIVEGGGFGSDYYDPSSKTVSLSPDVYSGRSISAAAAAAHECGHAVQHATAYSWLNLRTTMIPVVNFANGLTPFLFIGVIIGGFAISGLMQQLILLYIIILGLTTVFSFITLPVEIDASKRALAWLNRTNVTLPGQEQHAANDALKAAAYTYVVAALSSLAMLLYYLGVFRND